MKKTLFIYLVMVTALFGSVVITNAMDIDSAYSDTVKETWIGISGTASDLKPTRFTLDYGKGKMIVDMDGWKWYTENYSKMNGDKVTVYGRLEKTLFEGNIIDATSVYDEKLGKYFFGRSGDEATEYKDTHDPIFDYWGKGRPVGVGGVTVQGLVSNVNGKLFTIDTGEKKLTINTSSMPNDPLDKEGYQIIRKGDYVSITGYISKAFMEKGELVADHIVVLEKE